jgi:ribokinase
MRPDIVVVGSINMDLMLCCPHLPRPGETVQGADFRTVPGGKGANQAVAAARLGASVALIGCVGADSFGQQAIAALHAEGIDLAHLHVIAGQPTGVAMVQVEELGENCIVLAAGANHALDVTHLDAAKDRIEGAALLVCQLETPLPAMQRAIEIAFAAGVPVLLNPAPAILLPDSLLRKIMWLVPNEGEAALLSGCPTDSVASAYEAAQVLVRRGAENVLITLGMQGVVMADARGSSHRPAQVARPLDTTGAGDAFVGALAAALAPKQGLSEAVDFAQRVAAYSVEHRGAQASMPRLSDLALRKTPQKAS